jgi:CRP/FNR family transcriptional regulator
MVVKQIKPALNALLVKPAVLAYRDCYIADSPGSRVARLIPEFPFMHRIRKRGDHLFHAGDPFTCFHILNAGVAKTCCVSEDGMEQVIGLHFGGDILGLEAMAAGMHGCDAVALDICDVLILPIDTVIEQSQRRPALMRELMLAFSGEIRVVLDSIGGMRCLPATGRVAAFLLEMSTRCASRGFSATHLQLRLTRQEIGSMLGLELETVSRAFSRFAQLGLISVRLREIVLLDPNGLQEFTAHIAEPKRQIGRGAKVAAPRHGTRLNGALSSPACG